MQIGVCSAACPGQLQLALPKCDSSRVAPSRDRWGSTIAYAIVDNYAPSAGRLSRARARKCAQMRIAAQTRRHSRLLLSQSPLHRAAFVLRLAPNGPRKRSRRTGESMPWPTQFAWDNARRKTGCCVREIPSIRARARTRLSALKPATPLNSYSEFAVY